MRDLSVKLLLAAALICGAAVPAWADLDDGATAFEAGDYATALKEWRPLAEQGDANAQFFLGIMYRTGEGVPQDGAEAVKWLSKAAEQGLAEAQFQLGSMYANGEGVPENDAETVRWWQKAAEQGEAEAQFNLGYMYEIGEGVIKDYVKAYMWLSVVGAQGLSSARDSASQLEEKMTPEQIERGLELARECFADYGDCRP